MRFSIDHLQLTNFRKFASFRLKLNTGNILAGPNNSGKSSILDAFRILEACFRHTRSRNPSIIKIGDGDIYYGYEIPDLIMPFSLANITHNYTDYDATLEFRASNKIRAVIRLHPERQTKFYLDGGGPRFKTSSKFRDAFPVDLVIVPTLAPLEADEPYVIDQTVQRNATGRLASRVLRNIWLRRSQDEFDAFRIDVESAWPSIRLQKPEFRPGSSPPTVEMFYSEDRIDREVQWAGFGFQVWLQIQTHLRRGGPASILIIDEPDIYLHPDLQRLLLRAIRNRFSQFVMATHAV
jgi:predicted ATPase